MVASYLEILAARRQDPRKVRGVPQILQFAGDSMDAPMLVAETSDAPAMQAPMAQAAQLGSGGTAAASANAMQTAGDYGLKKRAMDEALAKEAAAKAEAQRTSTAAQEEMLRQFEQGNIPEEQLIRMGLLPEAEQAAFASRLLDPTKGIDPLEQAKLDQAMAEQQAKQQQEQAELELARETGLGRLSLEQDAEVRAKEDMLADNALAQAELDAQLSAPEALSEGQVLVDPTTGEQIAAGPEKTADAATTPAEIAAMQALGLPMTREGLAQFRSAGRATDTAAAPKTPEDVALMEKLGYPLTPEGYAQFQAAGKATGGAAGGGKAPSGYEWAEDGSLRAIKGGPADPMNPANMSDTQLKLQGMVGEFDQALGELQSLPESTPTDTARKIAGEVLSTPFGWVSDTAANTVATSMNSEEQQRRDQASRVVTEMMLRFKTGAAATEDEVQNNIQTYVPQPGDSPETVKQKMAAIQVARKGLATAGGLGQGGGPPAAPAGPGGDVGGLSDADLLAELGG